MTTLDDHESGQRAFAPSDSREGDQIRWLSFRMYTWTLIVGALLYVALELDRSLAIAKVGFVVEGRHWIRAQFRIWTPSQT